MYIIPIKLQKKHNITITCNAVVLNKANVTTTDNITK